MQCRYSDKRLFYNLKPSPPKNKPFQTIYFTPSPCEAGDVLSLRAVKGWGEGIIAPPTKQQRQCIINFFIHERENPMNDHYQNIYYNEASNYERLIAREDQHGNLFQTIMELHPFDGAVIAEFGAGTGRLTRILSVLAKYIYASDIALPMLQEGQRVLTETGMENWAMVVADNRAMPLENAFADITIEGWSFGHTRGWSPDNWQAEIDRMIGEMQRLLKPNGTMILIETMGTGQKQPQAPNEGLAELFAYFEQVHGLEYRWIRTDYHFQSVEEADELIRFFFGDAMADKLVAGKNLIVPECTGIWWKKL